MNKCLMTYKYTYKSIKKPYYVSVYFIMYIFLLNQNILMIVTNIKQHIFIEKKHRDI